MHNEEGNVELVFQRLTALDATIAERFGFEVEVIINDNASTDATFQRIRNFQAQSAMLPFSLRVFRFSRNIGFQRSILVGYCKAKGDAVVQLDADMQDPPELIPEFIAKWLEGYYVVYGVRRSRAESRLLTLSRKLFYRLIDRISPDELPHDSGDFRLVDRRLVDVIRSVYDQEPYLRGLIASFGMKQIGVPYDRAVRKAGVSKFDFAKLLRLSIDGITNHSVAPLRLATVIAFVVVAIIAVLGAFYVISWGIGAPLPAGFMTQVLLQLVGIGTLAALIGIQGEYVARIYSQVKDRPLAIIESKLGREPRAANEVSAADQPFQDEIEVLWIGKGADKRN